jgi:hypothetical protein
MNEYRRLPNGTLLYLGNLHRATTAESLAMSFQRLGVYVPTEHIDIRQRNKVSHAIVSIPSEAVANMVNALLAKKPDPQFRVPIAPVTPSRKREAEQAERDTAVGWPIPGVKQDNDIGEDCL